MVLLLKSKKILLKNLKAKVTQWQEILLGQVITLIGHQLAYRILHSKQATALRIRFKRKPMEIYKQTDDRWKDILLGESIYKMGTPGVGFGCTTTVVAQLLTLAGYSINPGDVVTKLNAEQGYTNNTYSQGAGLLYWRNPGVEHSFPQFHFNDGGPYHFWSGRLGAYTHWIGEKEGIFYDSITGKAYTSVVDVMAACGVKGLHLTYTASIDSAPVLVPIYPDLAKYPPNGYPQATVHSATNVRRRIDRLVKEDIVELLPAGTVQDIQAVTHGVPINGIDTYFIKPNGLYFWSGNTDYDGNL